MAIRKPAPAPTVGVAFGALSFYAGGSRMLPRGLYAMEHDIHMFTPTKADGTPSGKASFLAVQLTAHPIDEEGNSTGEAIVQQLSMGSKASLSFAPHPETGKGLVLVPGGPSSTLPTNTNWQLYLKSLYDAGLPEEVLSDDFSVIDGIWVRTDNVPEPEERKGYGTAAATGEASQEQNQGPKLVPTVIEILENGKPWEGTGGIPDAEAPKAAPAPAKKTAPAKPAPAAKKVAPAPAPAPEADEDEQTAASNAITSVLEKNPNGCTKIALRTGTFKALQASHDAETTKAIMDSVFANDDSLNAVLADLGYQVAGIQVKPV